MTRLAIFLLLFAAGAHAQTWVALAPAGQAPSPRDNAAGIYDPVGHRLVVFGGLISGNITSDTWALDLAANAWSRLAGPGAGPSPRFTHNALYDPVTHRMLVWSGRRGRTNYNDLWAFDLAANTWSEITTPDPKPNPRYGTAAVYDPQGDRLVNFAGFTDDGRFDDTWAYGLRADTWTDHSAELRPGARCLHTAAYDPLGHRMLMFGGQRGGDALGDLWSFDLAAHTWNELTPAEGPAGRTYPAGVYDARGHRFVVFGGGGVGGRGPKSDETWAYDLEQGAWNLLQPAGTPPPARSGAVAVYVESENRLLVFGGAAESGLFNDVWALENLTPQPTSAEDASWGQVKLERR